MDKQREHLDMYTFLYCTCVQLFSYGTVGVKSLQKAKVTDISVDSFEDAEGTVQYMCTC